MNVFVGRNVGTGGNKCSPCLPGPASSNLISSVIKCFPFIKSVECHRNVVPQKIVITVEDINISHKSPAYSGAWGVGNIEDNQYRILPILV